MTFELVTTFERFAELEPSWGLLWQQTGAMAFQSHPWLAAWAKHRGRTHTLRIGLIWDEGGRLAAALPMAIHRFFGLRVLEWAGQAVCDYCTGLGSLADMRTAWTALRRAGGVDVVRLKNIDAEAAIATLLTDGALAVDDACLKVVSNWPSGEAWFRTLNKKKRNNFTRGQRILEEMGQTEVICLEAAPDAELVVRLFTLKKAWLGATRQSSYLIDDSHPHRLFSLIKALAQIGRLRLFMITCGGDIVSASVNIAEGPSVGAFFAVYNPKFDRASPGIMLMTAYTRWAFNNGFTEIDYLRGGEGYKLEFANAQTTLMSFVAAGSPLGRAALFTHRLWYHIAKFRESRKNPSRKGGAYTTKAGNARTMTLAE